VRILLDTNLLIRAAITPEGLARKILRLIEAGADHILVLSPYLLSEVADVLRRDRIRARWPLTDEEVYSYCQYLASVGQEVSPPALPHVIQDPKDQAVLDAAVAGAVAVICTLDTHFTMPAVLTFCAAHSIRVLNDVDLIHLLRTLDQPTNL
jgi:putative PIN family toxin of toxin-antitoxin system